MKYYRLFILLFATISIHAQQERSSTGYEQLLLDESSLYVVPWTQPQRGAQRMQQQTYTDDQSLSWYVYLTQGEYRLNFDLFPNQADAAYQVNMRVSATEGSQFAPVSKTWTVNAQTVGNFYMEGIRISREAFYKIEMKSKALKGTGGVGSKSRAIETPAGKGGSFRFARYKTSPSVHLRFMPDDEKKYEYDWLYGEILVPTGYDPMYTFWMCIGFYRGYFGIQVNSDVERRVLFSIWDSSNEAVDRNKVKTEDRVVLLDKNPEVYAGSFGNEGTGGQSYRRYNWVTGVPVKFLMNIRKLKDGFVAYSAWFMDNEKEGWKYMATWQAPRETRYFDGFYSFVENFGRGTGQMVRKGEFYNMWGRLVADGKWTEFNKARLTHTDGEPNSRSDYGGGVLNANPTRFYMTSGGYTDPVDDKKIAAVRKTNRPPKVDIVAMEAVVDQAILTKAYMNDVALVADRIITVSRAEAPEAQMSDDLSKTIDGDMSTVFNARWALTDTIVPLTYYFDDAEQIDYCIYYPQTGRGLGGNIREVEVWVSTESQPNFVKTGDYDFRGASMPSTIQFPGGLKSPKAVRFVVKQSMRGGAFARPGGGSRDSTNARPGAARDSSSARQGGGGRAGGMGDFERGFTITCAEMTFFQKSRQPAVPPVFTDETCSELRQNVSRQTVDAIENNFYRRLASSLLDNSYEKEFRIQEYKPYPRAETMAERNKTSTYSQLDNPTGICVRDGDEIIVFVGKMGDENLSLRLISSLKDTTVRWGTMSANTFRLNEGANRIIADRTGLLYIMYNTDNANAKPVKIHFATGRVNGYYDVSKHAPEDWKRLLDKTQDNHFDMLGKYAHITYPVESLRSFCPDGDRLMQVYDSITWLEQNFLGFYKYDRVNRNRMYFFIDYNIPSGVGAYASSYFTGYPLNSMRGLCNPDTLRSTSIWGPAHEAGHVNQTRPGFRWGGMGEVSNNVYSMHVQYSFGNKSRLAYERLGRNDGNYTNRYEKGFTEILAAQALHATYSDVFCKLIPFWQLELYYSHVKGNKEFYADVHEQIRLLPNPATDSEAVLTFIKICCDIAKEDLTDFFKAWGLLRAVSSADLEGTRGLSAECTQAQVDEIVKYAKKYPKAPANLHYIHDDCLDAFRDNAKITKGTVVTDTSSVKFDGWKNVTVFEVYDEKKLVFISPKAEFNIFAAANKPTVYAVPVKGKKIKIKNINKK